MDRLAKVFSQQEEQITLGGDFKDEYETFKSLVSLPKEKRQRFHSLTLKLLDDLEQPSDLESCAERSRRLREKGNLVFRSASKDPELVLGACRLYTDAVLEAEEAKAEQALAFANRGMALQEYGYYSEAYDDCANALDCGYPEKLQPKVIMRQAHCAWKLEKTVALEEHLASLDKLQLNDSFLLQLVDLKKKLQLLKDQNKDEVTKPKEDSKTLQEIITDSGQRGRYMVSKVAISQGSIIFSERASCFVPLEQRLICQQCAATLMSAPIPCPQCHQRVVYCSRKCRESHAKIHKLECAAYRKDLLKLLGVSHLALRLVLVYIPLILPELRGCTGSQEIWDCFMKLIQKPAKEKDHLEFLQSLRMVSHLKQASQAELVYHVLCANLLQVYLKQHTEFFEQFNVTSAGIGDWQLFISALILRSAGQLLVNGHVGDALLPIGLDSNEFALLQPDMWQKPRRLKLGQLHNLAHSELITAINLPYLSLCNHACAPSIRTKFDGCLVVNYSDRDIASGEEILNCYTRDYRNSLKLQRTNPLKEVYKFQCSCDMCTRSEPDQDYLKFHRYRCEKANCRHIFVPDVQVQSNNLTWWGQSNADNPIVCTVCKERQNFTWYNDFLDLVEVCAEASKRQDIYKAFAELDNWLVENHSLKRNMAGELVTACFAEMDEGCILSEWDGENLAKIIRHQLESTAAQSGATSMEYITKMTFLWDLIALEKCSSNSQEILDLKCKLEYMASEHKEVFLNYYNDFIEQKCK